MSRVTRYGADRTNQKLYFARLACKSAKQAANTTQGKQLEQAARESAIFHLYGGYQAFLQELSWFYGLNLKKPELSEIRLALAKNTQVSPEVLVLEKLVETDFLGELIKAFWLCQYPPRSKDKDEQTLQSTELIIKATQLDNTWLPHTELLIEWHSRLSEQIANCRSTMLEH